MFLHCAKKKTHHAKEHSSSAGIAECPALVLIRDPSQSAGISPPVKRILLPGGVMLLHNHALIRHFNFFPRQKKVSSYSILSPAALSTAFFLQCRAIKRERLPLEQKLSSTPQNLLDREMEKTRAIHSNPPFPRQDGWRVKPRFTLKSYQLQLGFSIAHRGWENVA